MPQNNEKERSETTRALSFFSHVGITITVCVLVGVLAGKFLDDYFGASPWLLLFFSLMSVGVAFKFLLDFAKRM